MRDFEIQLCPTDMSKNGDLRRLVVLTVDDENTIPSAYGIPPSRRRTLRCRKQFKSTINRSEPSKRRLDAISPILDQIRKARAHGERATHECRILLSDRGGRKELNE